MAGDHDPAEAATAASQRGARYVGRRLGPEQGRPPLGHLRGREAFAEVKLDAVRKARGRGQAEAPPRFSSDGAAGANQKRRLHQEAGNEGLV